MKKIDEHGKELRLENESLLRQLTKERNALDKLRLEYNHEKEMMQLKME